MELLRLSVYHHKFTCVLLVHIDLPVRGGGVCVFFLCGNSGAPIYSRSEKKKIK